MTNLETKLQEEHGILLMAVVIICYSTSTREGAEYCICSISVCPDESVLGCHGVPCGPACTC